MRETQREGMAEHDAGVEARVARLEAQVARLTRTVERLETALRETPSAGPASPGPASPGPASSGPASEAEGNGERAGWRKALPADALALEMSTETWLSRVGIGLLLVGLAFLFKYATDQGWLGPAVRVAFGGLLGVGLLGAGLRLYGTRRRLSQVLLGGGVATCYTTVYAAYALYALLGYGLALATMVTLTVVALALSVRQDDAVLAFVGTVGGLWTPFILYTESASVPGLATYVSLLFAATAALYVARGWRSLLYAAAGGGGLVLFVAALDLTLGPDAPWTDRAALQASIVVALVGFGGGPTARVVSRALRGRPPVAPLPSWGLLRRLTPATPAFGFVLSAPLLALTLTGLVWSLETEALGGLALAGAGAYAAGAEGLRRLGVRSLAWAHALAAATLAAATAALWLDGPAPLAAWAVEGAALHLLAQRVGARRLRLGAHALHLVVALWLAGLLSEPSYERPALVHADALVHLGALAMLAAASCTLRGRPLRQAYRVAALGGLLAWWWAHLVTLPGGQAYVSAAWAATAVALLGLGVGRPHRLAQGAGLATLLLFVGKLFLVDLARLAALTRILLFLGSGGAFLLVSYYLPGLLPTPTPSDEDDEDATDENNAHPP